MIDRASPSFARSLCWRREDRWPRHPAGAAAGCPLYRQMWDAEQALTAACEAGGGGQPGRSARCAPTGIAFAGVQGKSPSGRDARQPRSGQSAEHPHTREIEDRAMAEGGRGRHRVITGQSWEPQIADDERRPGAGGVRVHDDQSFLRSPARAGAHTPARRSLGRPGEAEPHRPIRGMPTGPGRDLMVMTGQEE